MSDNETVMLSPSMPVSELLASTAAYLYQVSSAHVTGDPDVDLTHEDSLFFLYLAEHLLVYVRILPEDWEYCYESPGG